MPEELASSCGDTDPLADHHDRVEIVQEITRKERQARQTHAPRERPGTGPTAATYARLCAVLRLLEPLP
jgi:hypothetical protein